jgi:hypothetical protein
MGIPVEWTTVSRYLEVRLPTPVRALGRKVGWKGFRGKLRLIARDLELTLLITFAT